jgi:multiple sugar transport system ATP-binding protein
MNLLHRQVSGGGVEIEGHRFDLEQQDGFKSGDRVLVGVRAENLEVSHERRADAIGGRVHVVEPLGSHLLVTLAVGDQQLKATTPADFKLEVDQEVWMTIKPGTLRVLPEANPDAR